MTSVYATRRFPPGKWDSLTQEKRNQVWDELRAACAEKAAAQGLTPTLATRSVEEQTIRWTGDHTEWKTHTEVIAVDVTVRCDTTKIAASGETRQDVLDKPRDQRES